MTTVGLIVPPDQPPHRIRAAARTAEDAGLDSLWLWEDCFATSGMGPAAVALADTQRLRVGVGLFPVPLRNVALTAMELASLAEIFPGRFLPGIGHGVQEWMAQVGGRAASPLTLLREYATALRALLDGERVTTDGRYVHLDQVELRRPTPDLPVLVGAEGPRTLALAGEVGDGVILTGDLDSLLPAVRTAREAHESASRQGPFDVVGFLSVSVSARADQVAELLARYAAAGVDHVPVCGLSEEGAPESGERLLDLVPVLAQASALLTDRS